MNAKEIKTAVSNLEKSTIDEEIISILKVLKDGVKASESLLRETKVGVAVNKHRSSDNQEIVNLVKTMIKKWKDEVKKSKQSTKKSISSTTTTTTTEEVKSTKIVPTKNYGSNRSFKNDGIDINIFDNKTRNNSLGAIYNALVKDSKHHSPSFVLQISQEIEKEVFSMSKFETGDFYRGKLRTLVMNIRSANNPELRAKLLSKTIIASKLVKMSPDEMVNDQKKKELEEIEKANLFKAKSAEGKHAVTDSFICGKCKQRKVTYYQMQTRSADEPLTTFCECTVCGNHWAFS